MTPEDEPGAVVPVEDERSSGDSVPTTKKRSGPIRALVIIAISLGCLAVLSAVGVGIWVNWLNSNIERIEDPFAGLDPDTRPSAAPTAPGQKGTALNVLILGSDSRVSAGDPTAWEAGAQRTDAIMLAHLTADGEGAYIMSIPRDSWVPVPGYGEAKINAAFSWGGPTLMIQTVEDLTGIRIDHFAIADFTSFKELTDALGGVEITVPEDTWDRGKLLFSAGTQRMDGEQALSYTRQRYGLPGGDFDRVKRQQNWMRAILAQAQSEGLSNPVKLTKLVATMSKSVAVDSGLDLKRLTSLGLDVVKLRSEGVTFLTAPVEGTGRSPDGKQSIVVLDRELLDPLAASIANDTVSGFVGEHADDLEILGDFVR